MDLYGKDDVIDVMIEAKAKERALICYRDGIPIPEVVPDVIAKMADD